MDSLSTTRPLRTSFLLNALLLAVLLFTALFLAATASAQIPDTLKVPIPPPFGTPETGVHLGRSVAVDAGLTVVGERDPNPQTVTVFDTNTGAVLYRLRNTISKYQDFGRSVAISGTRVAVWAGLDAKDVSAGTTFIYDLAGPTPTIPIATLNNPNRSISDLNISPVAISGTRVVVGAPYENTGATLAGSAYVFDLASATPTVPVATLHNPTPGYDLFGSSVSISGTRVLIGVPRGDTGAADAGNAYVYDLASATPSVPVATLSDPDLRTGDQFGASVAISGMRLVVGAARKVVGGMSVGAAYAYDLAGATPTVPTTPLNNPDPTTYATFGTSVAIAGTSVVVGALFGINPSEGNPGGAYFFDLAGAAPGVPIASLNDPLPGAYDSFGAAVALSGTSAVVGAPYDNTVASGAGRAFVYNLTSPTPAAPAAILIDPRPSISDAFGNAIAISGTRMVIAASGNDSASRVTVYDLASSTPTEPVATLQNPNPVQGLQDNYGLAVAISGTRIIVGTPYRYDQATSLPFGTVYVYDLTSATPSTPVLTLQRPGPFVHNFFGFSVATSGTKLIVGDPYGTDDGGSAYVYDLANATPGVPIASLSKPDPTTSDNFGASVAISGTRLVIGSDYGLGGGNAYVYDLAGATPNAPVATLHNLNPLIGGGFGHSVAVAGQCVIVGAFNSGISVSRGGIVYIYNLDSANPNPTVPALTLNNPQGGQSYFGYAVAVSGNRLVVGDYAGGPVNSSPGIAYVYDLAGATPNSPIATLNNPNPDSYDQFGTSVAIMGTAVVVGAPGDATVAYQKGYAYLFGPANNDFDGNGLLDLWEYAHFGDATGHFATGDDERDGVINLLEEAFDTDPLQPDAPAIPTVVNEDGYLTITVVKHPGVTYLVESAATPDPAAFSATTTTVLVNNSTILKARDNFPIGTTPGRFLRVKVTAAP